jgi:NAD(P)-dependent dehydrogenase (short-subunit alcohol dehydrogenase family)
MPSDNLSGRTAVVTGGTSGIGRATALLLAHKGAAVFVGDVRDNGAGFEDLDVRFQVCDVRKEADIQALIDRAVEDTGKLDILVNNAGIGLVKQITSVTEDEWDNVIDTNVKGMFFGCKHAVKHMRSGGGGAIVNVSSNAGLLPRAHDPVYSLSKQAVTGLTKSLALCHGKDRVRINAVCPGPVGGTDMMNSDIEAADDPAAFEAQVIGASPLAQAFGRMITPEEIAEAILYLVSDAAVMVTGTSIAIDGGKSLGVPPR